MFSIIAGVSIFCASETIEGFRNRNTCSSDKCTAPTVVTKPSVEVKSASKCSTLKHTQGKLKAKVLSIRRCR